MKQIRREDIGAINRELFEPEPEPRPVYYTVLSVDDHLIEAPDTFDGRLPRVMQDRAPTLALSEDERHVWEFDGRRFAEVGLCAVAGRRLDTLNYVDAQRFEEMRKGCWDAHARVRDMDIDGVWTHLLFPSSVAGFAGSVFARCSDPALGLACVRAWNDWFFEEWYTPYPERFIPMGISFLADPEQGAAEIRRNAERGFKAVSLPERPHKIGYPSLFEGDYWDPIVAACAETGTVINLHIGSSGFSSETPGAPIGTVDSAVGFQAYSMYACADWLFSPYPRRHPDLQIVMSEGGIGWVAMMLDRLDHMNDESAVQWNYSYRMSEVLHRNFRFCTFDDRSTITTRHRIGIENIMIETDYPHTDGTWPNTQEHIRKCWGDLPAEDIRAMCSGNAARIYRHPLPEFVLPEG
jgi:predicted TIM-barrel fold metal-dependent hydrolase